LPKSGLAATGFAAGLAATALAAAGATAASGFFSWAKTGAASRAAVSKEAKNFIAFGFQREFLTRFKLGL
jgi:hypothetical protein